MLFGQVHADIEEPTVFDVFTCRVLLFDIQIIEQPMGINEAETLALAIADTCFRQVIFQTSSNLTGLVFVVVEIERPQATKVVFDGLDVKGLFRETYFRDLLEICQQRVCALVCTATVNPEQGLFRMISSQYIQLVANVLNVKNKSRRLHV